MDLDPFGDETHFVVDVTVKQRNGRKMITYIANIPTKYDLPKILKYLKKSGEVWWGDSQNGRRWRGHSARRRPAPTSG